MMKKLAIQVGGVNIDRWTGVTVELNYASIADTFAIEGVYEPKNEATKPMYEPLRYRTCVLRYGGQRLITGTLMNHELEDSATTLPARVTGYTQCGVLMDALPEPPTNLQRHTVAELVREQAERYGIKVVVDDVVVGESNKVVDNYTFDDNVPIAQSLVRICRQYGIVLSHTRGGDLLLTRLQPNRVSGRYANLNRVSNVGFASEVEGVTDTARQFYGNYSYLTKPIAHLSDERGRDWLRMQLQTNGQQMHRDISVVTGALTGGQNVGDSVAVNPYVGIKRSLRVKQSIGDDNLTQTTARAVLGQNLQAIRLNIDIQGWELGGQLVTPNQIITVTNKRLLLNGVRWFVDSVRLRGDVDGERATLTCVLPEVYNTDDVKRVL